MSDHLVFGLSISNNSILSKKKSILEGRNCNQGPENKEFFSKRHCSLSCIWNLEDMYRKTLVQSEKANMRKSVQSDVKMTGVRGYL
jgi:hypothetical protein